MIDKVTWETQKRHNAELFGGGQSMTTYRSELSRVFKESESNERPDSETFWIWNLS